MANRYLPFAKWIWSKRNLDVAFRQSTVTQDNVAADPSLPSPPLSGLEAIQFFRFLEDKELIFPLKGDSTAYAVNSVETYKWEKILKELRRSDWRRSWLWEKITSGMAFTLVAVASGFLGAGAATVAGLGINQIRQAFEQKAAESPANEPPEK